MCFSRWLHLESNAAREDIDAVSNMKLDEINSRVAQLQNQISARPVQIIEASFFQGESSHGAPASGRIPPPPLKSGVPYGNDGDQMEPRNDEPDLGLRNEAFERALSDCVESVHDFVLSTRTAVQSRASAMGSIRGPALASECGQPQNTERRAQIEAWIAAPTNITRGSMVREDYALPISSTLSRAEGRFLEICEEVERLGHQNLHDKAADTGLRYLRGLWEQYGPRLREFYSSDSYMSTYMTDQPHGQQLRRNLLRKDSRGFAEPEASSGQQYTLLHFLAHIGCLAEFRLWLIRSNQDPNTQDHAKKTALIRAAHMGHSSIVAHLLELPSIDVNISDRKGHTALEYATQYNHTDIVELFLKHLESDPVRDRYYLVKPLKLAAQCGRLSVAKLLISKAELDMNAKDEDQETALHAAIIYEQFAMTRLLLEQPAIDADRTNGFEETPLLCSARLNRHTHLRELLESRHNVNVNHCGHLGRTALSYVASYGDMEAVRLLISRGADTSIADERGFLPLLYAASTTEVRGNRALDNPPEERTQQERLQLVQEFLKASHLPEQDPEQISRFMVFCTERVEKTRQGHSLTAFDLGYNWFENLSPPHQTLVESNQSRPLWNLNVEDMVARSNASPKFRRLLLQQEGENNEANIQNLAILEHSVESHCYGLIKHSIVPKTEIDSVRSVYLESIASHLAQGPSLSVTLAQAATSPRSVMALAMLRGCINVVFVIGPSHSGKSRFIYLACGNVGKRIKATENLSTTSGVSYDVNFVVTGAWISGVYYPVVEVRYKDAWDLTYTALQSFKRRYELHVGRVICTLPWPTWDRMEAIRTAIHFRNFSDSTAPIVSTLVENPEGHGLNRPTTDDIGTQLHKDHPCVDFRSCANSEQAVQILTWSWDA